jgi:hypothetical protein
MSVVTVGWDVDRREEKGVSYVKDDIDQNPPARRGITPFVNGGTNNNQFNNHPDE